MKKSTCYGILWGIWFVFMLWAIGQQVKYSGVADLWSAFKALWAHVWDLDASFHPQVLFAALLAVPAVKLLDVVIHYMSKK